MPKYYSASEAAAHIGMKYGTFVQHLRAGNLQSMRIGLNYAVEEADLTAFAEAHAAGHFTRGPKVDEKVRLEKITQQLAELQLKKEQIETRLGRAA